MVVATRTHQYECDAEIVDLVTSPGHSYWFHSKDPASGVGPHPTLTHDEVDIVAGRGIVGDRFFGRTSRLSSAVSFVAAEAVEEVACELGLPADALDPVLMRRNVVTRGIDLNALVGRRFTVGDVECIGRRLCEPCAHLERLSPGTLRPLVHRGGLRADLLGDGVIRVGDRVSA